MRQRILQAISTSEYPRSPRSTSLDEYVLKLYDKGG